MIQYKYETQNERKGGMTMNRGQAGTDRITELCKKLMEWGPRKAFAMAMAVVVVFTTTYSLILPAITIERQTAEQTPGIALEKSTDEEADDYIERKVKVEGAGYTLTVRGDSNCGIPADAVFTAKALDGADAVCAAYTEQALNAVDGDEKKVLGLFDLTIRDAEGNIIQPAHPMSVSVDLDENEGWENAVAVHFPGSTLPKTGIASLVKAAGLRTGRTDIEVLSTAFVSGGQLRFHTGSFSVFVFVGTTMEKTVLASDGNNYRISVTYGEDAGIPENAELDVREILDITQEYEDYVAKTEEALAYDEKVSFARFFDIAILADGLEVQPSGPVEVKIELADALDGEIKTVHFEHDDYGTEEAVMLDASLTEPETMENAVLFETEGFSVYGVVTTRIIETTVISADGETWWISVSYDENAGIPEGAVLDVREIREMFVTGDELTEYEQYLSRTEGTLAGNERISSARFFDIRIMYDGMEIQPLAPVEVEMDLVGLPEENENVKTLHFGHDGSGTEEPVILDASVEQTEYADTAVRFETDGFSVYGVVTTRIIETTVITADGETYRISVTYDDDAGIPEDAALDVQEILSAEYEGEEDAGDDSDAYETYLSMAEDTLGWDAGSVPYARLFDIRIVSDGLEVQPAEGSVVSVRVELADSDSSELSVVHFGEEPEILDNASENGSVTFETQGFSVYAIVEAPAPVAGENGWNIVTSLEELASVGQSGVYVSHKDGNYFRNEIIKINGGPRTGIARTVQAKSPEAADGAVPYYFSLVPGTEDQFYAYCFDKNGNPQYVIQSANSLNFVSDLKDATPFTVSFFPGTTDSFRFLGNDGYYWNRQGGVNGKAFAAYASSNDVNARIRLEYYNELEDDPYDLDGRSFGIAYHNETTTASAMTAERAATGRTAGLAAKDMLMRPDVLDNSGILLVSQESDITEWTFESIADIRYYLSAKTPAGTKYLAADVNGFALEDNPDPVRSVVKAVPGSGEYSGKWHLFVNGYLISPTLNASQSTANGFWPVSGSPAESWLNMVEKSGELTDKDFKEYDARKVSASDREKLPGGAKVILYTRIWNENTLKYDFYAVDHDGSLIRCYDGGDIIQWIGGSINTAVWNFTEYYDAGTMNPSFYYELQNEYSGKYIAPQLKNGQTLSDQKIGINMNGRRYGDDYTTIIAWDDPYYEYAGLKTEDGHLVSCPLSQADDFYFAIVEEPQPLTTVRTIDSDRYGISMKMVDFNNPLVKERDSVQSAFFGGDNDNAGLLSTNLDDNGYPHTTAITGHEDPLSNLFTGMTDVNHLFLESVYDESGYFQYDSTQNFATLKNENGETGNTFTVYDQLGAIGTSSGNTRAHGQFMPYNIIREGFYSNVSNRTTVTQEELSDTDPRKGERMYLIPQNEADYFFGMEMEASFTQTPSGLDAWGHDIIFEFSGDDDFWLYVDGELVLDLGGVHSAMTASINFRTGDVRSNKRGNSTLYNIFASNYRARGLSEAETQAKLDEIFVQNGDGQYIFRDYTNHTMKMFYMERGAGASNLKMRFNLASAKPGTVVLDKTVSGTDRQDFNLAEFPYQIWYKSQADGEKDWHRLGEKTDDAYNVTYEGKNEPVRYLSAYTPAGGTDAYEDVFFLKAGQSADIRLPNDVTEYYIIECGVSTSIYDEVKANGTVITGESSKNAGRADFPIGAASITERPRVTYDNHVDPAALRTLTITKKLYAEDGETLLTREDDPTTFSFRLYLGGENDENLELVDRHPYHVKDEGGHYCRWDSTSEQFISLEETDYSKLTEDEKRLCTFYTSIYGAISRIPAGFSAEVRELVVGTQFLVEERESEIPLGYILREEDGYSRVDGSYIVDEGGAVNGGTIRDKSDPAIEIRNQRGWGLSARKIWSDASFMEEHDPVYLAVFKEENGQLSPVDGTLRELSAGNTSASWYFDRLDEGASFSQYVVREVTLDDDKWTPVENNGSLTINGWQKGDAEPASYTYRVIYTPGTESGAAENVSNIRRDTVTNTRDGIRIRKTDWAGKPLTGASFTLRDSSGVPVGEESYTSAEDGTVTIAYLANGEYTLTETEAPAGYLGLREALKILVGEEGITLDGPEDVRNACIYEDPEEGMSSITVKNRTFTLEARKTDENGAALQGAGFDVYRQVIDGEGNLRRDYTPVDGYKDLVSAENGIIVSDLQMLKKGTYYLTETKAPEGYKGIKGDLCFTISENGQVELEPNAAWSLESTEDAASGEMTLTITVANLTDSQKVSFKKVDIANPENTALAGAVFDLYPSAGTKKADKPLFTGLTSGEDGMLTDGSETVFELEPGTYYLTETAAPSGYNMKEQDIILQITSAGVTYDEGTALSMEKSGVTQDKDTRVYLLKISNTSGYELPATGGPGTGLFTIAGIILLLLSAAGLTLVKMETKNRFSKNG